MAVLIANDEMAIFEPSTDQDEHGWALPGQFEVWTGLGNLQLSPGVSGVTATDDGGHGPFRPATDLSGTVYLPPDCPVSDGQLMFTREQWFVLSQVHLITDPGGGDENACMVATATGIDDWPEEVLDE